jgi:glycine cleavage system H protein
MGTMDEQGLKFSDDHVWVMEMGDAIRLGLSDYAQEQLGEILSVSRVEEGRFVEAGETLFELESQKTVVELPSPVTGTVRAANDKVVDDPSLINVDPYGKGWIVEIEAEGAEEGEELDRLMDPEEYETFTEE